MGWVTGFEPATSGATVRRSTAELYPPWGSCAGIGDLPNWQLGEFESRAHAPHNSPTHKITNSPTSQSNIYTSVCSSGGVVSSVTSTSMPFSTRTRSR